MKFPFISDIATQTVSQISDKSSLFKAMNLMLESQHRNIVVTEEEGFYILNILDIIRFQEQEINLETQLFMLPLKKAVTISKEQNVLDSLNLIKENEFLCVINQDGSLFGLVSRTDITSSIDPETMMQSYRLKDLFNVGKKSQHTDLATPTSEVLAQMVEYDYDNIIIMEKNIPVGILTTKDIIELLKTKADLTLPIKHYMITPIETVPDTLTIQEALKYLKQKHYKRVVVITQKGHLDGVIHQAELITLAYSNWVNLMKRNQEELVEINAMLANKNEEFQKQASTDALTGLYNRYKLSELFLSSYKTMLQRENKMSLLMLDIDHFKKVNDTYGHNVGDKVLIQMAHAMIRTLRNIDIIARWGGEEFVMLLPTAGLDQAMTIAEKLRKYISNLDIDEVGHITASIGVSEIRIHDSLEEAIKRADDALYLAKESGRNCVKAEKL